MTVLLEIKARIIQFIEKYEIYLIPALKFILAIVLLMTLNKNFGYMEKLDNAFILLIIAVICAVLPWNGTVVIVSGVLLIELYALDTSVCIIGAILLVVTFFIYYRFAPKTGYQGVLTPLFFHFHIPYVLPIANGLLGNPYTILSPICGTIIFYYLKGVKANEALFEGAGKDALSANIVSAMKLIWADRNMIVYILAFVVTTLVVYIIRRLLVEYAWYIAIAAGAIIQIVVLIGGMSSFTQVENISGIIIGSIIAVMISIVIEFFMFHIDYTRTERVQFEDDSYFYYVKAVPKNLVQAKEKKVTKINTREKKTDNQLTEEAIADELGDYEDL